MSTVLAWGVVLIGSYATWSFLSKRGRVQTTSLPGPPSKNWLLGHHANYATPGLFQVFDQWLAEYGPVFWREGAFGGGEILLADPKALSHVFSHSDDIYHLHPITKGSIENLVGQGLLAADGESHKRQWKAMAPGFTTVRLRQYAESFLDCAHKLADALEAKIGMNDGVGAVMDIQLWINAFALDTIGIAGFSHDFGALSDHVSPVLKAFNDMHASEQSIGDAFILLFWTFLSRACLSTPLQRAMDSLSNACRTLARELCDRVNADGPEETSVLGLLVKAQQGEQNSVFQEELTAQIRTTILAGFETTSATLTWTLIELCKQPSLQTRLREELLARFPQSDPDFDTLTNELPLLDAIVHETLRLHPPIAEAMRRAQKDDVIPLSAPVRMSNGQMTDHLVIAKGSGILSSAVMINRSPLLWGEDASQYRPDRWLEGLPRAAEEISGYRHTMTFLDGPKACIGRGFAVTNIKTVLAVLVRKHVFELPSGQDTSFDIKFGIAIRPIISGAKDFAVPMRVTKFEA